MVATKPLPDERPAAAHAGAEIVYPDSDGEPMSDNTLQFQWIVLLKENLDAIRSDFVAGDLLWYPVQGRPDIRIGPDVLVALDRPKGYRGSYKSWVEGKPPEVVIEVLSPSNSMREMMRKAAFYARHGAREFIVVDPDANTGWALLFGPEGIESEAQSLDGWTSPTLGIRFAREDEELKVYAPSGERFILLSEAREQAAEAREQAAEAREQAAEAREQAAEAREQAAEAREQAAEAREQARRESERAERLAARLKEMGVDPDAP